MKPIDFLIHFCEKPGMYTNLHTFESIYSFIEGYSWADQHETIKKFREWLVVEHGEYSNVAWYMLVQERIFPDSKPGELYLIDQHELLRTELINLLIKFKEVIENDNILNLHIKYQTIYDKYKKHHRFK